MSESILILGKVLVFRPETAKRLGLNEAIILQQIAYWTTEGRGNHRDGRQWVYKTHDDWKEEFPWWSTDTIKRTILKLEKLGVLESTSKYNKMKIDKTKWYSVNFEHELLRCANMHDQQGNLPPPSNHSAPIHKGNLPSPITKEYTENTAENKKLPSGGNPPSSPLVKNGGNKISKGKEKKTAAEIIGTETFLDGAEVESHEELLESYRAAGTTVHLVHSFWTKMVKMHHPSIGTMLSLTVKDKSMLKTLATKLGSNQIYDRLGAIIQDWDGYTKHCETAYSAFNCPTLPNIGFTLKFAQGVVSFSHKENAEESGSIGAKPKGKMVQAEGWNKG